MSELSSVAEEPKHSTFVTVTLFLVYWVAIGYALGTITLIGPVRWYVDRVRDANMGATVETAGVIVSILVLVVVSALFARLALVVTRESTSGMIAVPLVVFAAASAAYALWMHPLLFSQRFIAHDGAAHFVYGAYPDEQRLRELKSEGFTVVSLLHPAVVPVEPRMLHEEIEAAKRVGVPFVSVPMLPWVSGNTAALEKIRQLTNDKSHRFYVHCYVGRDRVQIVKSVVDSIEGTTSVGPKQRRSLSEVTQFERGKVHRLGNVGWIVPYPTPEEIGAYIAAGEIRQVVALLDPNNPDESRRIVDEEQALKAVNMPFLLIPVPRDSYDAARAQEIVAKLKTLPRPVAVHAFLSPESGKARWAEGVLSIFESGAPALPASLFQEPLGNGTMTLVGRRVIVGPEPRGGEIRRLWDSGIRNFICIGNEPPSYLVVAAPDAQWKRAADVGEAIAMIRAGGTYYVFGGGRDARSALEEAFD